MRMMPGTSPCAAAAPPTRRQFLSQTGCGLLTAWTASSLIAPQGAGANEAGARPPNVVLILTDDLGWRDLGCYGNTFHETPHIDRLAGQGMRFTDAYAAAPTCSPTRASLLTGKYPARLGMTHIIQRRGGATAKWKEPQNKSQLPLSELTLFEALKAQGYATAHIGKWHVGGHGDASAAEGDPTQQGADINVAGSDIGQPPDYFYPYRRTFANGRVIDLPHKPQGQAGDYLDERLTDEAEKFITANHDKPFFLYLSNFLPHTSTGNRLQARAEKIAKYQAKDGSKNVTTRAVYAAMIEHLDDGVGRIMRRLDELGLADNTLVIFTSDNGGHGQKTSNAPLRGAKGNGYEGGIRVPAIVRWPGRIAAGATSAEPIITPDFYPTILKAAAHAPQTVVDGANLLPLLTRDQPLKRKAIFWHYPHFSPQAFSAVRVGRWKLIEFFDDSGTRHELYDLTNDISEQHNLATQHPDRVRALQLRLDQWRNSVGAKMPTLVAKMN